MRKYDPLANTKRLLVMRDLALLDSPEEPFFDRLTHLASEFIGVPVSLVTLVANDYQFFKSMVGLPEPWASDRRTPLSHSFCQHVVNTGEPLIVEDARQDDLLKNNKAIPDLDVIGYLGMPLRTHDGKQLGSFCVIDSQPHKWSEADIELMRTLAALVNAEIDARGEARQRGTLHTYVEKARARMDVLMADLRPNMRREELLARLHAFTEKTTTA